MTRGDLTDVEWEPVEPHLPLGAFGPLPDLRSYFNAVMWRFRTGSPWRDVPGRCGSWPTVYDRFRIRARGAVFQTLMDVMITEAAARDDVDLSLVSVDSTVTRAHHHAAGMVVDPELLEDLEKAAAEEKGAAAKRQDTPWARGPWNEGTPSGRNAAPYADTAGPDRGPPNWAAPGAG
ncbi:transposase [Streptomyces sp. NPDC020490]|uniref:transposase n=1 Tax=Streptomyces sp. NPDC020490 TaxID=3365078 RepID=UPI0037B3F013